MLLTALSAVLCFVAAVIMLSPYFRKIPLLHPMAVYLLFVGAWMILSYLIGELYPTSVVPSYIFRIGTAVLILYYLFILFMTRSKSRRKNGHPRKARASHRKHED